MKFFVIAFILQHFWVVGAVVTLGFYFRFRVRGQLMVEEFPELEDGYVRLGRGILFLGGLTWLVMGVGCVWGNLSGFDFLTPSKHNPFVLAWYGTFFMLWILGSYWIFFRGGAEALIKYPGLLRFDLASPAAVKLGWVLFSLGGIMGLIMIWFQWAPGMEL